MHIWCQQRRWEITILLFLLPFLILKFRHTHISQSGQILHPLLSLRATKGRIKASRDKNEFWLELDCQRENHLVPGFQVIPVCHPHLARDRHNCESLSLRGFLYLVEWNVTIVSKTMAWPDMVKIWLAKVWPPATMLVPEPKKDKYNTNNNTRAAKHCFIF